MRLMMIKFLFSIIVLFSCNYAMAQTEATPITQGMTLDNPPTDVVNSISNVEVQQGINLNLSVLQTFRIFRQPKNEPYLDPMQPRCKANWNTGGRTCWYNN